MKYDDYEEPYVKGNHYYKGFSDGYKQCLKDKEDAVEKAKQEASQKTKQIVDGWAHLVELMNNYIDELEVALGRKVK